MPASWPEAFYSSISHGGRSWSRFVSAVGLTAPRANSASERVVPLKSFGDHPAFSVQSLGPRGLGSVRWREPYADTPSYVSFELHIWHARALPVLSAALVAAADH